MRGSIDSSAWGARSAVTTMRAPVSIRSLIVWRNSSCVDPLPAMNWISSINSSRAARNRALNAIVSLARIALTNSIMKRSADM